MLSKMLYSDVESSKVKLTWKKLKVYKFKFISNIKATLERWPEF
ncbi:hypothetical protein DET49_10675 [Salegentibacter sp. 24]|jgi:hypothetical protein|nr:hypothetical protein DET49_10675 [Salegentibacter sp. 24]